jgi:hypothetical protein
VIADRKHIFIFIYNPYLVYVKTIINNGIIIQTITKKHFLKILKNIRVDSEDKSVINLKTIFESSIRAIVVKNLFRAHDVSACSQNPNVLSIFKRYLLNRLETLI